MNVLMVHMEEGLELCAVNAIVHAAFVPRGHQLTVLLAILNTLSKRMVLAQFVQMRPILKADKQIHVLSVLMDALPALVTLFVPVVI